MCKGKGKGKSETRYSFDCGEQAHIGVNCPYKWTNSIDEEDDETSSCESEPEGENVEELASLETPGEEGEWCWPKKSGVTRWRRRIDSRPAVHYLAEEDEDEQVSRGTESPGLTKCRRNSVVVEEGHRGSRLRRSRECDAEEHVPRDRGQTNREVQEWKRDSKEGGENIKNYGQQIMSVTTPEGFVRKSTWQVADVRRPLVSASHIIQGGNDLVHWEG